MIYELEAPNPDIYEDIAIFVDPAAGGPSSDYGIMSVVRKRGTMVVRHIPLVDTKFTNLESSGSVARWR